MYVNVKKLGAQRFKNNFFEVPILYYSTIYSDQKGKVT